MRIAFVGKGGSGKTTTASLYAEYESLKGNRVLALDADINQHIASALGHKDGELEGFGQEKAQDDIKKHLRGSNNLFAAQDMQKTTPPGEGSNFVTLDDDDWFMSRYTQKVGGTSIANVGEVPDENVGVRCYHGLNGIVELVLGHMLDKKNDRVIVDMTAGADAFSSTLFAKVDAMVLVVEPTIKSLSVYDQFKERATAMDSYKINLLVVANKIQDDDDVKFVRDRVGSDLIAVMPHSSLVRARERGDFRHIDLESGDDKPLAKELEKLSHAVASINRDWNLLQQRSHDLHKKNASDWMGGEAMGQIDENFSLAEYAAEQGC